MGEATHSTLENPPVAASIKRLALQALAALKACERCGSTVGVRQEPCRTCYADAAQNISPRLCRECAEDYHLLWDEQWADYINGTGVAYVSKEQLTANRKRERIQQ